MTSSDFLSDARTRRVTLVTDVALAVGYVGAIFYTGLIRLAKLPEVGFMPTDKLLHALAFGGLGLVLARAARVLPSASSNQRFSFGVLGASLLGALLEVCQSFVPYRSAEFLDWVADTVGALLAVGIFMAFLRFLPRRAHG